MPSPMPQRRLTLVDTMVLIVAVAVGLALAGSCQQHLMQSVVLSFAVGMTVIFTALAVTVTLILLVFRQPRPRHIGSRPGTVACCAVALALVFIVAEQASVWFRPLPTPLRWEPNYRAINLVHNVMRVDFYGAAVAGAWLALILCGRWRPQPDWLDRTGRVLGFAWIVLPLLGPWLS